MDISSATQEKGTVLSVSGRVDTATAPALEQAINREIDLGHRKILLNFSGVNYISSGGLRVLLAAAKKLKNPDDRFGLSNLNPEVLKILKLAGFTSIFSIYPSEGEALAGW
ncbi:STAS domain-containing protein [uncultured Methanoregula sp.]|uniref:STAS domain-containing protein n=1 Tax=uncultured Methanoregula sp. TaxID=1005933 RepID=UPI002AAB4632|nr:STAS domain-containing protein [uncultured Methanoregula sp.]